MQEIINTSINDSTWTPVTLGATQSCKAYMFWTRDETSFKVRAVGTTNYATLQAGSKAAIEELHGQGGTLFEAQTESGTDIVEVLIAG